MKFIRKFGLSRLSPVLHHFQKSNIVIKKPFPLSNKILNWIKFIKFQISNLKFVQFFTDGSTKQNNYVSGIGIFIVQLDLNIHISIDTNGNNYFAEIMAITICAVAANSANIDKVEILTDSKSSLESICKFKSDRNWTRTPLRGWVALLSQNLSEKIKLIYVPSHVGVTDLNSFGNNRADALAKLTKVNRYIPFGLPDFCGAYIYINNVIQTSGIKNDAKKCTINIRKPLLNKYKQQTLTIIKAKHSDKIKDKIYKYCMENNEKLWSFWILATLRWLIPAPFVTCNYCFSNEKFNTYHLNQCPILKNYNNELNQNFIKLLKDLKIPNKNIKQMKSNEDIENEKVNIFLSEPLIKLCIKSKFQESYLFNLAKRYINTKPLILSSLDFVNNVNRLTENIECKCIKYHKCYLKNCWSTPLKLMEILKYHFKLEVEGCADPLHLSHLLSRFVSNDENDKFFGGEYDILKFNLAGNCTYINPPFAQFVLYNNENLHIINALIKHIIKWINSNQSTRIILLIPETPHVNGKEFINNATNAGGKIIFSFSPSTLSFIPPSYYSDGKLINQCYFGWIHLVLFENQMAIKCFPYSLDNFSLDVIG